jgi:hypothetical protein
MRLDRIGTVFLASLLAGAAAAPAFAQSPYDGQWQVTIVTNAGSCEPTAGSLRPAPTYPVRWAARDL